MEDAHMMVIKRDGKNIECDMTKIIKTIEAAFESVKEAVEELAEQIVEHAHDIFQALLTFLSREIIPPPRLTPSWYFSWFLFQVRDLTKNYRWTWFEDAIYCYSIQFMVSRLQESSETFDARANYNEALVVCS